MRYFFNLVVVSFVFTSISCLILPFITELICSFWDTKNLTEEIASFIVITCLTLFVVVILIFEFLYVIRALYYTIYKIKPPRVEEEESDEEEELGLTMYDVKALKLFVLVNVIIHIVAFFAMYIDWKHYVNCQKEFIIDLSCFVVREAFVGPIDYTNTTITYTVKASAVIKYTFHFITVIAIIISFVILIITAYIFSTRTKRCSIIVKQTEVEEKEVKKEELPKVEPTMPKYNFDPIEIPEYMKTDIQPESSIKLSISTDDLPSSNPEVSFDDVESSLKENQFDPEDPNSLIIPNLDE